MESFGLFDLLKALFLSTSQNSPSAQASSEKNEGQSTAEKQASSPLEEKDAQARVTAQTREESSPSSSCTPNACLEYFNRHDELSRRRKNK